jgi:5'-3' exonuclease
MGVHRFFYHIVKTYPQCLIKLNGSYELCETANSKNIHTDWLELDLNSIFHPVAQQLYHYGITPHKSLLKKRTPVVKPNPPESILFAEICNRIEQIKNIVNPKMGIYFSTDGVAGMGKVSQQRKRRFKGVKDSKGVVEGFDSNSISCGTLFMERLSKYIDKFVQSQLESNPKWENLEIIISNHRVASEGEHKCIHHMKNNPDCSFTIVSPDADLIFLSMGTHNPHIYVFRENIFDNISATFFLVDISCFRSCVLDSIRYDKLANNTNSIIEDFILFCFFIGNDFLPQIPSINMSRDGIGTIMSIYSNIIHNKGYLTEKNPKGEYTLRKSGLKAFLFEMAQIEQNMIIENKKFAKVKYPDRLLERHIYFKLNGIFSSSGIEHRDMSLNMDKYKQDYYITNFNDIDRKIIAHEYLKGMLFVFKYYVDTIPSWTWCYPFHYAPFFSDLYDHIDSFDIDFIFEDSWPLSPLEQLVAILPSKSSYLLPEPLRMLSTSDNSPIIDMFPTDFEIDLDGKAQEYEGVCLLPHIDEIRLANAFADAEKSLSEYDRKRNHPGKIFTYTN